MTGPVSDVFSFYGLDTDPESAEREARDEALFKVSVRWDAERGSYIGHGMLAALLDYEAVGDEPEEVFERVVDHWYELGCPDDPRDEP